LPKHTLEATAAKFAQWQEERRQLAEDLAKREAVAQLGEEYHARVAEAIEHLGRLEEVIDKTPADKVRDVLARLVSKVTVHFPHLDSPNWRGRPGVISVDVEFRPEVRYLCSTTPST
jgi:hypothetical protein